MKYAKVAVEAANYSFDMKFDYIIPPEKEAVALRGCRVKVPFGTGSRKTVGVIFDVTDYSEGKRLKKIDEVLDEKPLLNDEMLRLADYIKDRTFCTFYEAAKAMLPSGINHRIIKSYAVNPDGDLSKAEKLAGNEKEFYSYLASREVFVKADSVFNALSINADYSVPASLVKKGLILAQEDAVRNLGDATLRLVRLLPDYEEIKLTAKQKQVCSLLLDVGTASVREICEFLGVSPAVVNAVVKNGGAEFVEVSKEYDDRFSFAEGEKTPILLTDEQSNAFEKLKALAFAGERKTALLYGVTGSGKTSVYMRLIDEVLEKGKSVLVLVPEIGLTPQVLSLFCKRYGSDVAVFHSALSLRERNEMWKKVKKGEAKIIIGTRSAVFAPVENLGLIVIDEEQEHTYKSEQSPRYNTVDVAKFRAAYNGCLLLLASATPSVETYASALSGKYELCTMKNRYGTAVLPDVLTVDMRRAEKMPACREISRELYEAVKTNYENGRQSILLINRRGYNTFAACESCQSVITCPNCSISMTYHIRQNKLICHYCGATKPFTGICPECGENAVRYSGFGTQKIEDELALLFPEARILRMDADTTGGRDSHEKLLGAFEKGEYDIMVGTQMVAKGLNFPNVTLVGVISVDQQLYNDDFRSLEKTFSLLTQVVGRSGRGETKGTAIIQTLTPENEIIRVAARQDYDEFFNTEIKIRRGLKYPPYCEICVLGLVGTDESIVRSAASTVLESIKREYKENYKDEKFIVLGPVPARVAKVGGKFRFRIIIKCKNTSHFREMISKILKETGSDSRYKSVTVYADMNPDSVL